ncbi:MAG: hypothetical protein WAT67_11065 [Candidatus Contendobacter sp.]
MFDIEMPLGTVGEYLLRWGYTPQLSRTGHGLFQTFGCPLCSITRLGVTQLNKEEDKGRL